MLVIDGAKYEVWTPPSEDEFERVVKEHAQEIFGEQSIYLDTKQKLKSVGGIGSIPDGYVIEFGNSPKWHIIEVELSSHPLYEHIVSQMSRFISGISNPNIQRGIVNAIYEETTKDDFAKLRLRKAIEPAEIYKFLADLISKQPVLTIIIEKDTQELREALSTLHYPQIKVVEFQTFTREGAGLAVHAHLFEPLYKPAVTSQITLPVITSTIGTSRKEITLAVGKRVTVKDLIDANILKVGQVIYRQYNRQRYEGKILNDGSIQLIYNGRIFNSPSAAANSVTDTSENGWVMWYTTRENGTECLLDALRKEYRSNPSP